MNAENQRLMNEISKNIENGNISDDEILQYIEQLGRYLGLSTIANKAKELDTDYNNVKCSALRKVNLFGARFVIDNE